MNSNRSSSVVAQANIARLRYSLVDPKMAGMASRIDEMNQLAERSPGFVWRFQANDNPENSLDLFKEYIQPFDESLLFFNLSVWVDEHRLRDFVYRSVHAEMLRDRDQWVEPLSVPSTVMWRIESEHPPTVREALEQFMELKRD